MSERDDILQTLAAHRGFLHQTLDGLTDEQAGLHPTASALCLGGLVKHVAQVEQKWAEFIVQGPSAMAMTETSYAEHEQAFQWLPGDTVAGVLAEYEKVAAATDELVRSTDLDAAQPLPEAPWFEPGASRSARRVFLHIVAETAQHAGHADILRETIDGQKTMG